MEITNFRHWSQPFRSESSEDELALDQHISRELSVTDFEITIINRHMEHIGVLTPETYRKNHEP